MWEESSLGLEGVDVDFLSRYLGKILKKNEIAEEEFYDIVYTTVLRELTLDTLKHC